MDKPTGYATIWPETDVTQMMGKTNLCQSDSNKGKVILLQARCDPEGG